MLQNNGTRQSLMKRVQMYEFALVEAGLFLDTHPNDQQALQYHSKYSKLLQDAKAEYVKRFGELEPQAPEGATRWDWVDNPWPWDLEANMDTTEKGE